MIIKFKNDALRQIITKDAHKLGLPADVVKAARKTLIKLEAVSLESDLFSIGGLDYKILKGDNKGIRQIRISKQYRIRFTVADDAAAAIATIIFIGDPH